MKYDNIYIWGDSHGDYYRLASFLRHDMLENSLLIHVGDWGRGFPVRSLNKNYLEDINEDLVKKNSEIFVIRGNHDIPTDFDGRQEGKFTFLKDYTFMDINDERFGFIGGATSIDRYFRREGHNYWKDEVFSFDEDKCEACDVLILHTAPIECPPIDSISRLRKVVQNFTPMGIKDKDLDSLTNDLREERVNVSKAVAICKPNYIYYGHFHFSETLQLSNYHATLLNIDECAKHL